MDRPPAPWWKSTTVYQIYPRSFYDSDADGIGDLAGLMQKLDYVQSLGVETIWCSPFTMSPQADFGYDISDYLDIAPEYGSLEDCERLIQEVHARGMRIVFDLVLNHTSQEHPWFKASRQDRAHPKRDWYLWRDGRGPNKPPNNWRAMIGGSGWTYDKQTDQWYWATFLPFQPDLNYRNEEVKQTMLGIVEHWLKKGVDGFRLDIFNAIFKDDSFADNPWSWRPLPSEDNSDGFFQRNTHTINHPDTIQFAKELRSVVDRHSGSPPFLVGEVFGPTETIRRYCGEQEDGLHLVFLFKSLQTPFTARGFRELLEEYEHHFSPPAQPTYVFGNHDRPRRAKTPQQQRLQALFQLTARGIPFVYYGEELGMSHRPIPLKQGKDPMASRYGWVPQWLANWLVGVGILLNRDECRTPMQWDSSIHAGFSEVTPWLPVGEDAERCNVATQEEGNTLLNCYRRLFWLRKNYPSLHQGRLALLATSHKDLLRYRREDEGSEAMEVWLNFGRHEVPISPPAGGRQIFTTHDPHRKEEATPHILAPFEGILLRFS